MTLFTPFHKWVTEEHKLFTESVQKFYNDEMKPNIQEWVDNGVVSKSFWEKAGYSGVMAGSVAEEHGGVGGDMGFDSITVYEQAKTGDSSLGYGIQSIVIHYLNEYGTDEQKNEWLPKLIEGKSIASLAMTEPGAGSDLQAIKTTAKKDGNQYTVNGSKIFIPNGVSADLIIVAAKTDQSAGAKGISLILLDTNNVEGFSRGKPLKKLGLKGNDTAELFFDNVKVPLTNLIGKEEGQGFYQMMNQLPWERLLIGITALGAIDFALQETIKYVQERKAFNRRIMDLQNTRFKLAESKTKAEVLRSFIPLPLNLNIFPD